MNARGSNEVPSSVGGPQLSHIGLPESQEAPQTDISDLDGVDPYKASPYSKYEKYELKVDHEAGDRGIEIKICSFRRPHMRALHCAWISFFFAFTIWFAPAPLLKEIREDLDLSNREIWTSSITNDIIAVIMRSLIGPICDAYGARIPMAVVLVLAAIPTAMLGFVQDATGLAVIRFFIGIAGSSFVMSQVWPSRMFAREIAGTANGIVGGWGNLGGGFTQLLMGSVLFPIFTDVFDGDSEKSWRTICVIPAAIALIWGLILPFIADDAPMGNYGEMKLNGTMDRVFFTTALRSGATANTWILYIQYACSFGVELVMNNAAVLYFADEFGLSTARASAIGFVYGSMNFFARGVGGYLSDQLNLKMGMRGRLWLMFVLIIVEGGLILVFAYIDTLGSAVLVMCLFSILTQATEGAVYGIVPYVSKLHTGSVAGLVGAGGNVGSMAFGFGFRSMAYRDAFLMMGSIVIAASSLNFFIRIPCHAGMIRGEDNHAVIQARERHLRHQRHEAPTQMVDAANNEDTPGLDNNPVEIDAAVVDATNEAGLDSSNPAEMNAADIESLEQDHAITEANELDDFRQ